MQNTERELFSKKDYKMDKSLIFYRYIIWTENLPELLKFRNYRYTASYFTVEVNKNFHSSTWSCFTNTVTVTVFNSCTNEQ